MYWRRFNLTGEPFSLTPDPAFLFLSSVHSEAYAALTMGLRERRGLVSMIGEVGTGKTTLVYSLLSNLGPEIHTAYISNARLSFDGILRSALRDFGVSSEDLHGVQLLDAFNDFLHRCAKQGTTAALVIDEAQNLSHDTFEDLRLLSNFETYKTKLLQIVLVGQPELDTKLRDPALRQVAERIAVRSHVNPLTPQETRRYIEHRLNAVGGTIDLFSEPAIRTIISRSLGIPRAVNILCHNAMLFAYGQAKDKIARSMVLEAVHEKEGAGLVRLGSGALGNNLPSLRRIQQDTPAWTWNAVFLILAVGLSVAMIRVAGNIRLAPAEPQATALTAAPLPARQQQLAAAPVDLAEPATADIEAVEPTQPVETAPPVLALTADPEPAVADTLSAPSPEPAAEPETIAAAVKAIEAPIIYVASEDLGEPAEPIAAVQEVPSVDSAQAIVTDHPVATEVVEEAAPVVAIETGVPPTAAVEAGHRDATPLEIELAPTADILASKNAGFALLDDDSAVASSSPYQIIDVEPGNSLSDLMIAIYGTYTSTMVQRVQALNPQITDPNVILAGDALRFPSDWKLASPAKEALRR